MKFKAKELLENAVREGAYIGMAKTYPANALLTIDHPEMIENITEATMARLCEIINFEDTTNDNL